MQTAPAGGVMIEISMGIWCSVSCVLRSNVVN